MFFYVFIDPETIAQAASNENDLGRLIDVLRSFDRDCLMAETDLWRLSRALNEQVTGINLQTERRMVGELLIHLWKRGPLIVMEGDDERVPLIDFAKSNAEANGIDLILSPSIVQRDDVENGEICSLPSLHSSKFSQTRHNIGSGYTFRAGELTREELFVKCFVKLIARAERIVIIDYALGQYFNNDQPTNLREWVLWINRNLRTPGDATLVIRTVRKEENLPSLGRQIRDLRQEVDLELELEVLADREELPHGRFLVVDGRCLSIDLGIDICHSNGRCKRVDIAYANRPR